MDDSVPRSLLLLVLLLLLLLLLLKATVRLETSLACSGPFAGKLSSTREYTASTCREASPKRGVGELRCWKAQPRTASPTNLELQTM